MTRYAANLARIAGLLFLIVGLVDAGSVLQPARAQVRLPSKPKQPSQFTCGPHLLTYEVFASNGQRGRGVRCVKVRPLTKPGGGIQFDFAWYGEGDWGSGPYRHVGYASNHPELPSVTAADIFGNGEKLRAAYPSKLDSPTNIKVKQIVGSWPTPNEIHLDGAWREVWKRVSATAYRPLPKITTCGPHFYEYQAQLLDPRIADRGVRCVSKYGFVWFGSGTWGTNGYTHLGIHEWSQYSNGVFSQLGPGEASDICDRAMGSFCNATPARGIQFTQQGNDIRVGGAWNELWVAPKELEVARKELGISILTINLVGVADHPCKTGVWWEPRYLRIAAWLKETGNKPDIIPLQEARGWMWCPTNPTIVPDYATMDFLLDAIRDATGEQYRIAYLVDSKTSGGSGICGIHGGSTTTGCTLWGDLALLYRPTRLRNVLATPGSAGVAHDDAQVTGPHLRRSLPACNLAPGRTDVADVIDGPPQFDKCNRPTASGLTWVQRQGGSQHGEFDAAFSRFELISQPGNFVHLYNVHLHWVKMPVETPQPGVDNVRSLVTAVENRFVNTPAGRLYAPILVGDFNRNESFIGGDFPDFRVGKWTPMPEVIGALVGKEDIFPSKQVAHIKNAQVLPVPDCYENAPAGVPGGGGPIDRLWSDHCALFFTIEPTP